MHKAIITGANGFIGSALVQELLKKNISVVAIDRDGCQNNIPQNEKIQFFPCDLDNIFSLSEQLIEEKIDCFYHLAWRGVSGSDRSNIKVQIKNVEWTLNALHFAGKIGCQKFICAGTIMEDEILAACSVPGSRPGMGYIYGGGKIATHTMGQTVAASLGIDFICAKLTNAYGPGENSPRLINSTLRKIRNGEPLQFTSGTQNYDFVYITDVARALYLIGEKGKPFSEYLIGSFHAQPLRNFLLELKAAIAPDREFVFGDVPYTGVNLPLSTFDCEKTLQDTGFYPSVSFSEGIQRTYQWICTENEKVETIS